MERSEGLDEPGQGHRVEDEAGEPPTDRFGRALSEHRQHVARVLPSGDPGEIKRLYVELGSLIDEAVGDDIEAVPALSFPESLPVIVAVAGDMSGLILDAGCGPYPVFSIELGRWPARQMVGLDISPDIVRLAAARCQREGVPFHGVVGDLESLPFRESVFDGCVCEDTIEHLPDDAAGVSELSRVTRRGGRLILGTPNRRRLDVVMAKIRHRMRGKRRPPSAYYAATSHLREYTWRGLSRIVRPHFRVARRVTVGWSGGWRAKLVSGAVKIWPFRQLGKMLILDLRNR